MKIIRRPDSSVTYIHTYLYTYIYGIPAYISAYMYIRIPTVYLVGGY